MSPKVKQVVGVCNCSMFCCTLLYVLSSIAIILMGKRELIALLNLSSWCLVMVERLFLAVPRGCLQFVIVVFPDHTHLLFLKIIYIYMYNYSFRYSRTAQYPEPVVSVFSSDSTGRYLRQPPRGDNVNKSETN